MDQMETRAWIANIESECRFCLHAVSLDFARRGDVAVLGDIPGGAMVFPRWVDGVGRRLAVYAIGPEADEEEVNEEGENGPADVEDEHRELGQMDEHAQYTDDKVELGDE